MTPSLLSVAYAIPAYQAAPTLPEVVRGVLDEHRAATGQEATVLVVDDGSSDETAALAEAAGAQVVVHPVNRGKGAALRTALRWALAQRIDALVSLDADGQHLPDQAVKLALHAAPAETLVLGVRDLAAAGAPRPNQFSNRFSNLVLSGYCRRSLADTQCGLRRYPVRGTLSLQPADDGFAFEAEVILRFARRGLPIEQVPVGVYYPPEAERTTHFDSVRDPARIVRRVVRTVLTTPLRR